MDLFCLENSQQNVGKTFSSTKVRYTWKLKKDGKDHEIYATNSSMSGKKQIYLDGYLIHTEKKYAGFIFTFQFEKDYNLTFRQDNDAILLYINGTLFQKLRTFQMSQRMQLKAINKSQARQSTKKTKEIKVDNLKQDENFMLEQQKQLEYFASLKKENDIKKSQTQSKFGNFSQNDNFEQFEFGQVYDQQDQQKQNNDFQFNAPNKDLDDDLDLLCLDDEVQQIKQLQGEPDQNKKKEDIDFGTNFAVSEIIVNNQNNNQQKKVDQQENGHDNPFDDLLLDDDDLDLDLDQHQEIQQQQQQNNQNKQPQQNNQDQNQFNFNFDQNTNKNMPISQSQQGQQVSHNNNKIVEDYDLI